MARLVETSIHLSDAETLAARGYYLDEDSIGRWTVVKIGVDGAERNGYAPHDDHVVIHLSGTQAHQLASLDSVIAGLQRHADAMRADIATDDALAALAALAHAETAHEGGIAQYQDEDR